MKKFLLLIFFLISSNLYAKDLHRELLIKFDGICVQNIDNLDLINQFAKSENWMNLPPGKDALVAPKIKGTAFKAFGFAEGKVAYLIGINNAENKNTCSIASSYNSIIEIKKILNEFYKLQSVYKQNQGIQIVEIFEVDLLQSEKKSLIVMNHSEQPGYKFLSLSVMVDHE